MNMDMVQCTVEAELDKQSVGQKSNHSTPARSRNISEDNHTNLNNTDTESHAPESTQDIPHTYKKRLATALFGRDGDNDNYKILKFTAKPSEALPESFQTSLAARYSLNKLGSAKAISSRRLNRYVPSAPVKVLDAPELVNDYYLNLLSWGSNNILAVALGQSLYLWNAESGAIDELVTLKGDDYISSVQWSDVGSSPCLAVGVSSSMVQLWDVKACKQMRSMDGHAARVGALAWNIHILSSGSRDGNIIHHDVRSRNHNIATLSSHEQEVCGLQWSPDGSTLASGGNDNMLCLWKSTLMPTGFSGSQDRSHEPVHRLAYHNAAVKAIAWCPWERNLLATGGGTADRTIKFWNTTNGAVLNSVDTGSQVCALIWSTTEKELISSHGYSQNEICLWKYPNMLKLKELTGHTSRVLHLAASPDGSTIVSGAADETLRFWKVFGVNRKKAKSLSAAKAELSSASLTRAMSIR